MAQPAALLALVILMNPGADGSTISAYVVSVAVLGLWGVSVFAAGTILYQDRAEGTLTAVILGTQRPFSVLVGRSLGAVLAGASAIMLSLLVMLAVLGAAPSANLGTLTVGASVVLLSCSSLGLLLSSLFILTRSAMRVAEALLYPVFVGSGILIPLDALPTVVGVFARAFNLYWANMLLQGASEGSIDVGAMGALVGLSLAYGGIGYLSFKAVVARSRRVGSLDVI